MGDINDDFKNEDIEITGGAPIKGDDDAAVADIPLTEDDELDAKEPDIPYKDEEESL